MVTNRDAPPHPYQDLPDRQVWRKAVADTHPLQLDGIYRRKFDVSPEARISTAGSCFAQHIAKALKRNGFNFQDFEPAPSLFPAHRMPAYNYGVYSARYCNIYTARQMLQTFERAMGLFKPTEEIWEKDGGVADPFRPLVEPEPFESVEELMHARRAHLASVQAMFYNTDIFIFTLGLTEAWISKRDGAVFPLCPGTVAGQFREEEHAFRNFTHAEILQDMLSLIRHLRAINGQMRFILTVSPVPLTATKTGQHVLAATTYSKSVLRGVAGELAAELDFVDYFPSYEIITAPSMRGMFYDNNLRTVNSSGVDYVMSHFLAEHAPGAVKHENGIAARSKKDLTGDLEGVCEEMMQAQGLGYA
ncbi:GSCFA domain-containing protein [Rhizobium oryzicola]|uniref:GSCFA domain-containing protein n=1 Tax=Rhizobium oryzicola TaxID=1232668 RepID=A0ABT8SRH0_9HYPH|nr:GSCFA domain-containing protein [Rhizobium oryzicola]MDO1581022.1 GSCFA domain-containing protein [Rhizobium oryzicola]